MSRQDLKSIISEILDTVSDDVRTESFNINRREIDWMYIEGRGVVVNFSAVPTLLPEELSKIGKRLDDRLGLNGVSCFNEAKKTISLPYRAIEVLKEIYIPQSPKASVDEKPSAVEKPSVVEKRSGVVASSFLTRFFGRRNHKPSHGDNHTQGKNSCDSLMS